MEYFVPDSLIELLSISLVFSVILMALIQKIKSFKFIKKSYYVVIINFLLSFILGIPFCFSFYNIKFLDSLWVGLFSFIGASTIYNAFKKQNLINIKPISIDDNITISTSKEIKR